MQIDFELTKQDYINFNIFHINYSKTLRKMLFIQRYIVSLSFLIVPFVASWVTSIPLWYWLSVFVFTYIIWILFYWKYFKWNMGRKISKMVEEGKTDVMLGKQGVKLDESTIINNSSMNSSETKYQAIENIIETKDYIYVYISPVQAYIIPVSAFENLDEKDKFVNKLNDKVETSKRNITKS